MSEEHNNSHPQIVWRYSWHIGSRGHCANVGGMYREPIAKKEAMDFCSTVRVGQSIEGIQERAIESGAVKPFAKWKVQGDGSQTMAVIYVRMPPFSRHICSIKATTTVVSAEYVYLD